jgi:hypothetical protein
MDGVMDKKQINQLSVHLESIHTLVCGYAKGPVKHVEKLDCDDVIGALDYFHEAGWRVIRGKVACPECVKVKTSKDFGGLITNLLEMSPLSQLSEDEKMLVAGQIAGAMQQAAGKK